MVTIKEYTDEKGQSPYANWFDGLDPQAAAKVATAILRMELGNFSNAESVGGGVSEYKIKYGPGYRVYFSKDGKELVILLGGGTKKRQSNDIETAKDLWKEYKKEKKIQKDKEKKKKEKKTSKKKR
jgi:putative addiction module killer protein